MLNEAHFERYLRAARLEGRTQRTLTTVEDLRGEIAATRARKFAEDAEEFMEGMIAIAVPILDDQQRLLSTLSFHAPTVRLSLEAAREHVTRMHDAAEELSRLVLL